MEKIIELWFVQYKDDIDFAERLDRAVGDREVDMDGIKRSFAEQNIVCDEIGKLVLDENREPKEFYKIPCYLQGSSFENKKNKWEQFNEWGYNNEPFSSLFVVLPSVILIMLLILWIFLG